MKRNGFFNAGMSCQLLSLSLLLFAPSSMAAGPPAISDQPIGKTVLIGDSITLRVATTGTQPVSYQWYKLASKLTGETSSTLVLSNVGLTAGGDYFAIATNAFGAATSSIAPVTVVQYKPEVDVTAAMGARVVLSVMKNGRPVTLRWFKGEHLLEEHQLSSSYFEATLTLPQVAENDAGSYCAVASNVWGTVRPRCTALEVIATGPLDAFHPQAQLPDGSFHNLENHHGLFFAPGDYQLATSTDSTTWQTNRSIPAICYDVAWGGGTYVMVGEGPSVFTSTDGREWSRQQIPAFGQLRAVTYGAGRFVVAAQQELFSSVDGTNWTQTEPALMGLYQDALWGGDRFVVIDVDGGIQSSTNGLNWEAAATDRVAYLYSVAYGNDTFVAVGSDGLTMSSPDGRAWKTHGSGTPEWFSKVAYGNGVFLAITRSSSLLSSVDGISWTIRSRGTNAWVEPFNYSGLVCAANGTFLVGAANNLLLETDVFTMLRFSERPTPRLSIYGATGRSYRIEEMNWSASGEPWRLLDTVYLDRSPFVWVDPDPQAEGRTYRAVSP